MTKEGTSLQLSKLRLDGGTQPRAKLDDRIIEDYAEGIRYGAKFPPVVVFYDGESYWLADGFHRFLATDQAGKKSIVADVRQGTLRDAILHSVGANAAHGHRRSNRDKRRAVRTMLTNDLVSMDVNGKPWSDNEIARKCNVSVPLVGTMRARLPRTHTINTNSMAGTHERAFVHPKTGKPTTMDTSNIGRKKIVTKAEYEGEEEPAKATRRQATPEQKAARETIRREQIMGADFRRAFKDFERAVIACRHEKFQGETTQEAARACVRQLNGLIESPV